MPLLRLTIKGVCTSFCNFFLRMLRKNWQKDFALDSRPRSTTLHSCPVQAQQNRQAVQPKSFKNTKVDRSAAYASRWVAKNVVAAGLAKKCEVQLAYAIGVAHPVSIMVDTFGTATVDEDKIEQAIEKVFDLRPHAIIKQLDLRKPIYKNLAAYGHMGREDLGVSWEKLDKVEELKAAIK